MLEKKKVFMAAPVHPVLVRQLEALGYQCDEKVGISKTEALAVIADYEGIVTSNLLAVDREIIEAAKVLKWIGRLGSGMDIIDQDCAAAHQVVCLSSPEGNANAVAEHALGLLLALRHHILKSHMELLNKVWLREGNRGLEIEGAHIGIIGLGHNGSALAKKCLAMGMKVLAYDKTENNYDMPEILACADLQPIFDKAEIISFHVPLSQDTHHYFDRSFLDNMQHPFTLLNLSRGAVVDIHCLLEGMEQKKVKAAALDVWDTEPYWKAKDPEYKKTADALMQNQAFIGNAHIGGYTFDALYKMSWVLSNKIAAWYQKHVNDYEKKHFEL